MKKLLFSAALFAGLLSSQTANAQLPDGAIAPDWTFQDLNGTTHQLYDYLDQGYTVFIDVSATWCGPCWSYHNTHALRDLYQNHGPTGYPSVVGGTSNDVMVFFIEGDGNTTLSDLQGNTSASQGDWISGTTYPIINPASGATNTFNNNYNIGYFPTVYMVCPNRTITEVGTLSATNLYTAKGSCPAPASAASDAALLTAFGSTAGCVGSPVSLETRIQNNGTSALTSATIEAKQGTTTVATFNWTGNLSTYGYEDVTVGTFSPTANTNIVYTVTASGDGNTTNNSKTRSYTVSNTQTTLSQVTVQLTLDNYPTETSWQLKNSSGSIVAQGGPYSSGQAGQTITSSQNLPNDCYVFAIQDSYGDGMCCSFGNGSYSILFGGSALYSGGQFTDEDVKVFKVAATVGMEEEELSNSVAVYPNPASDIANVAIELSEASEVTVEIFDLTGKLMTSTVMGEMMGNVVIPVSLENISNGMYLVNIKAGEKVAVKRLNVNR